MADTKQTAGKTRGPSGNVWSEAERAAMREGARERKKSTKLSPEEQRAEGERAVLEKIAELPQPEREMVERIHAAVTRAMPTLVPRTYYGMPAYAKDGKTICFVKPKAKFKERYLTLGFEQAAVLDDGTMWPTSFAVTELNPANEQRIAELVKKAAR